jgi:hypothetical protein
MNVEWHLLVREKNISLRSDKYGTSEIFNPLIISTTPSPSSSSETRCSNLLRCFYGLTELILVTVRYERERNGHEVWQLL